MAQSALVNGLLGAGLQLQQGVGVDNDPRVIRENRQQLVPAQGGGVRADRRHVPDVSYVAANGRRVNVEIDTNPVARQRHMRAQVQADPNAYHVSVLVRSGGSIPVVNSFQEVLGAPTVMMGFALPDDRIHAPNEKFHLPNFFRGIETSVNFLAEIARPHPAPPPHATTDDDKRRASQ